MASVGGHDSEGSHESLEFVDLDIETENSEEENFENPLQDSDEGIVPYRFEPYASSSDEDQQDNSVALEFLDRVEHLNWYL